MSKSNRKPLFKAVPGDVVNKAWAQQLTGAFEARVAKEPIAPEDRDRVCELYAAAIRRGVDPSEAERLASGELHKARRAVDLRKLPGEFYRKFPGLPRDEIDRRLTPAIRLLEARPERPFSAVLGPLKKELWEENQVKVSPMARAMKKAKLV